MNIAQPIEAISRRSLHTELVDRLRSLIVESVLAPGSKVPERDLCEQFGVSRTPMREALKVLAAEGLVSLEPNRGAWVSQITLLELEELFPVMGALEALSGELACARITEREVEKIRVLHAQMVWHYEAGDLAEYFRTNQAIHEAILAAADNPVLSAQYKALATRVRQARYVANMTASRWRQAVSEHEDMLAALEARDGDGLAIILKQHLANKFETVRVWLKAQREMT